MTERQVMAHAWELFVNAGHEGRYMFLGSDERIRKYRHAVFTDKPIERCAAAGALHGALGSRCAAVAARLFR